MVFKTQTTRGKSKLVNMAFIKPCPLFLLKPVLERDSILMPIDSLHVPLTLGLPVLNSNGEAKSYHTLKSTTRKLNARNEHKKGFFKRRKKE